MAYFAQMALVSLLHEKKSLGGDLEPSAGNGVGRFSGEPSYLVTKTKISLPYEQYQR